MNTLSRSWLSFVMLVAASACSVPRPYEPSQQTPPAPGGTPVETQPTPPPAVEEPPPPPQRVIREPTLGAASRSLVTQARAQLTAKNFPVAASTIERALRIEPDNPLLWIELGKVRQAEGSYSQAENMARKAASMAVNAPRTQSTAWTLVAEALRAQGKNQQAREAQVRANQAR